MKSLATGITLTLPLVALLFLSSAHAAFVGSAVGEAGSESQVGSTADITAGGGTVNAIEYFIPLDNANTGTYGVTPITCGNGSPGTAGTCYDYGMGTGYDASNALYMNIFFDLSTVTTPVGSANLSVLFDDLDLVPNNDPENFYESISLSYWKYAGPGADDFEASPVLIRDTMKTEGELPDSNVYADNNLITWELSLAALGDLNDSIDNAGGFWIQFGFGSLYDVSCSTSYSSRYGYKTDCPRLKNTPEYLVAALDVSAVPIPAAAWLFGTALLGFIGFARRTTI